MTNILLSWGSIIPVALLLGIGLAMDAFGISISHGFKDPKMKTKKMLIIASVFGIFQGIMPLIGWGIVYGFASIKEFAYVFSQIVPPLAFAILGFIGGKMIYNNCKNNDESTETEEPKAKSFIGVLILQGIATSIDALSSGLAMNEYSFGQAGVSILIIAVLTFIICLIGCYLGKRFGHKVGNKAELIGGIILIIVGTFILIKGEIRVNAPQIIPEWLSWLF